MNIVINILYETTEEARAVKPNGLPNGRIAKQIAPIVIDARNLHEQILIKGGVLPTLAVAFDIPLSLLQMAVVGELNRRDWDSHFLVQPYQFPYETGKRPLDDSSTSHSNLNSLEFNA